MSILATSRAVAMCGRFKKCRDEPPLPVPGRSYASPRILESRVRSLAKALRRRQTSTKVARTVFVTLGRAAALKSLDEVLEGLGAFTRRRSCQSKARPPPNGPRGHCLQNSWRYSRSEAAHLAWKHFRIRAKKLRKRGRQGTA